MGKATCSGRISDIVRIFSISLETHIFHLPFLGRKKRSILIVKSNGLVLVFGNGRR